MIKKGLWIFVLFFLVLIIKSSSAATCNCCVDDFGYASVCDEDASGNFGGYSEADCSETEIWTSCNQDCFSYETNWCKQASVCGDGSCDAGEWCDNCPQDCGYTGNTTDPCGEGYTCNPLSADADYYGCVAVKKDTRISCSDVKLSLYETTTLKSKLEEDSGFLLFGYRDISDKWIKYYIDNKYVGEGRTDTNGKANLHYGAGIEGVYEGVYQIKAEFKGDSKYNPSECTATLTIEKPTRPKETKLTLAAEPLKIGETAQLKAKLEPVEAELLYAAIKFYVDDLLVGIEYTNENGIAALHYTPSEAGRHDIKIVFEGEQLYKNSLDQSILEVIASDACYDKPDMKFSVENCVDIYGNEKKDRCFKKGTKYYIHYTCQENGECKQNLESCSGGYLCVDGICASPDFVKKIVCDKPGQRKCEGTESWICGETNMWVPYKDCANKCNELTGECNRETNMGLCIESEGDIAFLYGGSEIKSDCGERDSLTGPITRSFSDVCGCVIDGSFVNENDKGCTKPDYIQEYDCKENKCAPSFRKCDAGKCKQGKCAAPVIIKAYLVSGKKGEILDNTDKTFNYNDEIEMYAVLEDENGKYHLGDESGDYPKKIIINGKEISILNNELMRWKEIMPEIKWIKSKVEKGGKFMDYYYSYKYENRGWKGKVEIMRAKYVPWEPTGLDVNVGTAFFKVKLPEHEIESKRIRISRKGGIIYPKFSSQPQVAGFINTMKIMQGDGIGGNCFGSSDDDCRNRWCADCADLQISTAYHFGYIKAPFCSVWGANNLGQMTMKDVEPRTDWKGSYTGVTNGEGGASPSGIAFDKIQNLFVITEKGSDKIKFYNKEGEQDYISIWDRPADETLFSGVHVNQDYIYVADQGKIDDDANGEDAVYILSKQGKLVDYIRMKGPYDSYSKEKQITWDSDPIDIATDKDNVYVLTQDWETILKFKSKPEELTYSILFSFDPWVKFKIIIPGESETVRMKVGEEKEVLGYKIKLEKVEFINNESNLDLVLTKNSISKKIRINQDTQSVPDLNINAIYYLSWADDMLGGIVEDAVFNRDDEKIIRNIQVKLEKGDENSITLKFRERGKEASYNIPKYALTKLISFSGRNIGISFYKLNEKAGGIKPSNWMGTNTNRIFVGERNGGKDINYNKFSSSGDTINSATEKGLIFHDDKLYVALGINKIKIYDANTGEYISEFGTDYLKKAIAIAKDSNFIYVIDDDDNSIKRFKFDGEYFDKIKISGQGFIYRPKELDVGNNLISVAAKDNKDQLGLLIIDKSGNIKASYFKDTKGWFEKIKEDGTTEKVILEIGPGDSQLHPGDMFVEGTYKCGRSSCFHHTLALYKDANNNGILDGEDWVYAGLVGDYSAGRSNTVHYSTVSNTLLMSDFSIRKWSCAPPCNPNKCWNKCSQA